MSKIIQILKQQIIAKQDLINDFFADNFKKTPALFYNSVDLRHSGFKIAPVDTNCFPAGFNNIKGQSHQRAKVFAAEFIAQNFTQEIKKILIIPENHTRNLHYLENVLSLQKILQNGENQVLVGSMIEEINDQENFSTGENSEEITLHKIVNINGFIQTKSGFAPDLIILNNDLTSGVPEILKNVKTPIAPSIEIGWYQRSKSLHFSIYNDLAQELSQILSIDPWLISSLQDVCHEVDFKKNLGFECLADSVNSMIGKISEKYRQYEIKDQPFCYIKADSGTYGMAVMQVSSGEEALHLNKKDRNKMNMLKESRQNTTAIVQEGISTIDKISEMSAEPMIYLVNGKVSGNLFRANASRDQKNSLNAAGAQFFDLDNLQDNELCLGCVKENVSMIYEMIGKLAALAAARESY